MQPLPLAVIACIGYQRHIRRVIAMASPMNKLNERYHEQLQDTRNQKGYPIEKSKEFESQSGCYESNAHREKKLSEQYVKTKSKQHE